MSRLIRPFAVSAAGVLLVVGGSMTAGGTLVAKSQPARAYAREVCAAVADWSEAVQHTVDKVKIDPSAGAAKVKKALAKALRAAANETDNLVSALDDAGRPRVARGKTIAATLHDGFAAAATALRRARARLQRAPTGDAAAFAGAVAKAEQALVAALDKVDTALAKATEFDAGQLLAAFRSETSCKKLASPHT